MSSSGSDHSSTICVTHVSPGMAQPGESTASSGPWSSRPPAAEAPPEAPAAAPAAPRTGLLWTELDYLQLEALAGDPTMREAVFGSSQLNWKAIGEQLGRGAATCQRRWAYLCSGATSPAGQPKQRKAWKPADVAALVRMAEGPQPDWAAIGASFSVSGSAAYERYKLERHTQRAGNRLTGPAGAAPPMPGLFEAGVAHALRHMPRNAGTHRQVVAALAGNQGFVGRLHPEHFEPRRGATSANKLRWHTAVYEALKRHRGIQRVGTAGGSTLWHLLPRREWSRVNREPLKKRRVGSNAP